MVFGDVVDVVVEVARRQDLVGCLQLGKISGQDEQAVGDGDRGFAGLGAGCKGIEY